MRAAARAGDDVFVAEPAELGMNDDGAFVHARQLRVFQSHTPWCKVQESARYSHTHFDVVFMRAEPPIDSRFLTATLVLDSFVSPVFNAPRALREMNEKLSILHFPQHIAPTLVSADFDEIADFCSTHGGAVIKPLHGMGGRGIYVSPAVDMNLRAIIEIIGGGELLMVQQYIAAARTGDARVFIIDGKAAQWMLVRVPAADDHRGNLAAGGTPFAKPIDESARHIAAAVAPTLSAAGVLFAGLDVIGGFLTEINITCPTGLCEVRAQTGDDLSDNIIAAAKLSATS